MPGSEASLALHLAPQEAPLLYPLRKVVEKLSAPRVAPAAAMLQRVPLAMAFYAQRSKVVRFICAAAMRRVNVVNREQLRVALIASRTDRLLAAPLARDAQSHPKHPQ